MNGPREWSSYAVHAALGVHVLRAHFSRHAYGRHSHDEYVLGVVHAGAIGFRYRGSEWTIPEGSIFLLDPNEAHDGHSVVSEGFFKSVIYVPPHVMAAVIGDAATALRAPPA